MGVAGVWDRGADGGLGLEGWWGCGGANTLGLFASGGTGRRKAEAVNFSLHCLVLV